MYVSYNLLILIIIFVSFTIGLNLGLHGLIAFDQPINFAHSSHSSQQLSTDAADKPSEGSSTNIATTKQSSTKADSAVSTPRSKYETKVRKVVRSSSGSSHSTDNLRPDTGDSNEQPSRDQQPKLTEPFNTGSIETSSGAKDSKDQRDELAEKIQKATNNVLRYLQQQITADANIAAHNELVNPDAMGGGGAIPIVLLTCNRPALLKETLESLLNVRGVHKKNILVAQDGAMKEVSAIAKDSGLTVIQNTQGIRLRGGAGSDGASRIAQHYKFSLTSAFDRFPDADAVIIIEDDLLFSPDMYEYLTTVGSVLVQDPSAFVVSAWSDNGFKGKVRDPYGLRRTDYFPGLGWLLTRKLYKNELEPKWPHSHWDHWLRSSEISKHRDIIYPEVPRTYHNGVKGTFMNLETHNKYFRDIDYNRDSSISWALDNIDPLNIPATTAGQPALELPPDAYFLRVKRDVYDYRIEQLIKQCVHVKSTTELVQLENEVICVWVDVNTDCDRPNVPFAPLAAFFGLWHEHRRGNYKGVHEFYWENNNYVLLLNLFDRSAKSRHSGRLRGDSSNNNINDNGKHTTIDSEEKMSFRHLMPTTAKTIPANQFTTSLLANAKRKKLGVRGYKASAPGMSCDEVCSAAGKHCDATHTTAQALLNSCEALQENFPCLSCETSSGPEQPAYVKPDAAARLLPGVCLVTSTPHETRCAASHPATYRLCACS